MRINATVAAILMMAVTVSAQSLQTSAEYPLQARIVSVETNARQLEPISSEKNGNPYEWHLMKTIIGDKLYGLAVRPPKAFIRGKWLEVGTYPAKRVKDGFEFQYLDGKTIRHETLIIKSEELVPQQ